MHAGACAMMAISTLLLLGRLGRVRLRDRDVPVTLACCIVTLAAAILYLSVEPYP